MVFKLIVVGTSLGGVDALQVLLRRLPANFTVPVIVVLHRHKESDNSLIRLLQLSSNLLVLEVQDKEDILPGHIYIAPADYHVLIESERVSLPYFALSTDAPVTYARPSIDVLFETAADAYGEKVIGVLLTGANHDGVEGLAKIKANGGKTIVQEPSTAFCPVMPKAAIIAGVANKILPLVDIAEFLLKICYFPESSEN